MAIIKWPPHFINFLHLLSLLYGNLHAYSVFTALLNGKVFTQIAIRKKNPVITLHIKVYTTGTSTINAIYIPVIIRYDDVNCVIP